MKRFLGQIAALALSLCLCLGLACTGMPVWASNDMAEDAAADTGGDILYDEVDGAVTDETVITDGDYNKTHSATAETNGEDFSEQIRIMSSDSSIVDTGIYNGSMWYRFLNDGAIDIRGYRSSDNSVVQTTYSNGGYYTILEYNDTVANSYAYNSSDAIPFTGNGQSYNDGTLTVTPNISFSEDGDYAILTYTVTNISDHTVAFSLGMLADVDIDDDDYATVLVTNTGVNMINQNNNENYYLACRNLTGQDNADTLWVGQYPHHWENVFNNQINDVTGVDSAIALSWQNRILQTGGSAQYYLMIGIGEGTDIRPPEEHYHDFGEPVFNWSNDYVTCTAVFSCKTCDYSRNLDCTITSEGDQLIATVYFEDNIYSDTRSITIAVIDDGIVDNGVHMIGSGNDITLECSIPLEYFESAEVDGVLLDPSNYTLASGSTLLTLSSNYLDTLSVGRHTVTMNYGIETKSFGVSTIIEIQSDAIPLDNVPDTGDTSHFTLWITLACISAVGMIVICKGDKLAMIVQEIKRRK